MIKYLCAGLLVCIASSCTPMPRISAGGIAGNDHMGIMRQLDETRFDCGKGSMFTMMEGYQPASLIELHRMGRLKIEKIPALVFWPVGVVGYTEVSFGEYGDMYSANVYYTNRYSLIHELQHAQGFTDRIIPIYGDYSASQRKIMEEEGVSRWADTSYYKNEDPKYHWGGCK